MSLVVLSVNKNSFCLLHIITRRETLQEKDMQNQVIFRGKLFMKNKIRLFSLFFMTFENWNSLYIHGLKGKCTHPIES